MQSTTNYQLVKQELTDRADITQISGNWDKIDTQLKKLSDEKFDKTGGTITGKTTISKDGLSVTGGTTTDTLTANGKVTAKGGVDVTGTLTASGKITGSGGLAVTGGTSTDTLTTSGAATVAGKLTAKNGLDVTGAVTLQNVTASTLTANTFQALDQNAFRSRANVKRGTNPSAIVYSHWSIFDNAGWGIDANRLGRVQYSVNTDGTATIGMYVNKFSTVGSEEVNGIAIQWLADGTARVSLTHHPQAGSNDKQIATTNWVRSLTATTSEYGLVKLADETALLSEADDATLTVDASYELNDFRRMSTAYTLGDKVNCAFNFGVFLECTQAGTTSAETLDTRSVTHGQVISDGTVQWTVRTHVKSINGNVPDASGNVSIDTAPPIATTEEAKAGTDDTKMMTPLKTRQAIDEFAPVKTVNGEEPDEDGNIQVDVESKHILGDTWISIDGSVPAGGVPFCGQTVTRALYTDLYAWAQSNGKVKTESEWQSYAAANGGNCPYYSDGDGSTTFRMPCVKAYLKGATSASNAGKYTQEGLPDPQLELWMRTDATGVGADTSYGSSGMALYDSPGTDEYVTRASVQTGSNFFGYIDVENSIYGRSSNVVPETFTVLIGVYAIGEIGEIGRSADVSDILSAVAAVETEVNAKLDSSTVHIVDTGKTPSGWWRKWSDGFIEQGGRNTTSSSVYTTVTLHKSFSDTNYYVVGSGERSARIETHDMFFVTKRTKTSFTYTGFNSTTVAWYAAGY